MAKKQKLQRFSRYLRSQVVILGFLFFADQIFGFSEAEFFNTYILDVLDLSALPLRPEMYVSIMVSVSAVMGLIFNIVWGIISDNTRSRANGRRAPFILVGGVISGFLMIVFSFNLRLAQGNHVIAYILAIVIDGLIIGVTSNAYYNGERALFPDVIPEKFRGRANAIVEIIGYIGMLAIVALNIVASAIDDAAIGLGETGHFFLLSVSGGVIIFISIISFFVIKEPAPEELPPKSTFGKDFKAMFKFKDLKEHKEFFKLVLALTVFRIGIMITLPWIMYYINSELNLGLADMLMVIGVGFGGLFIIIPILGRMADKFGRKKGLPIIIIVNSILFACLFFVRITGEINMVILLIFAPFMLTGILGLITPLNAWSQDLLPEEKRGSFGGLLNIVYTLSQVIGSFIGGFIAARYFDLIWVVAPLFFIAAIPLFMRVKETLPKKE